ncbi:MAG: GntP family permease [Zymomonas mobilis subsp. pomaceae]|uniref:Gluconate transporter n=1 Tax=Zymomonas mobilis subsp. pomaceae (strain ATCC 29192 / DSM 22645 / JCM 10191 / CCUG 17912 / NBRC 13757 / NCIMB 11200 / NRRL B-4491 / Barker I) TaxID=579138 RepID=F8EV37_ZYMMT|nr:GntP family permease [Zymomonas mobilis]AEI38255.1 gluconate transporter [Zymomonas mobilis subsp. pomaceae ATCC 29192]MDX5947944.1 GntP family permease [Zymomonas mobilis subsp. pomaceae]GEB89273.1 2-keto-3-deoxygluconate permease [Zymomonas mobilis subsp. pomaceae]
MHSNGTMLLLYALASIIILILMIAKWRINPFVSLILVSIGMGAVTGMPLTKVLSAFQDGVGSGMGSTASVIALGTMLGKILAESGGAERIAKTTIAVFGPKLIHWAMLVIAFIVGIPIFYQVGFILLIPLVFTLGRASGISLVKLTIPLCAGLATVHGLLPPHPGSMQCVEMLHADVGKTILYGFIIGFPAAILAGPLYGTWIAKRITLPAHNPFADNLEGNSGQDKDLPGFCLTLFSILLPVLLMVCSSGANIFLPQGNELRAFFNFLGDPVVSLVIALLVSMVTLGFWRGFNSADLLKFTNDSLGPTAGILLLIGAGGGFSEILYRAGVSNAMADLSHVMHLSPIMLGFIIAAVIRIATGSQTVAMSMSGGMLAPIIFGMPSFHSPELLVLSIGAGSSILSHVNDGAFWLLKEYLNMTVSQTFKTWTVSVTIASVAALIFTFVLQAFGL